MRRWLPVPVALAIAFGIAIVDGDSGLRKSWRLRAELESAQGRIARLRAETRRLRHEVDALDGDGFAIERAIREELELARPGERLVRLSGAEGPSPRFP